MSISRWKQALLFSPPRWWDVQLSQREEARFCTRRKLWLCSCTLLRIRQPSSLPRTWLLLSHWLGFLRTPHPQCWLARFLCTTTPRPASGSGGGKCCCCLGPFGVPDSCYCRCGWLSSRSGMFAEPSICRMERGQRLAHMSGSQPRHIHSSAARTQSGRRAVPAEATSTLPS